MTSKNIQDIQLRKNKRLIRQVNRESKEIVGDISDIVESVETLENTTIPALASNLASLDSRVEALEP